MPGYEALMEEIMAFLDLPEAVDEFPNGRVVHL